MERLTDKCWRNLDPWECCGQDKYCTRDCHEKGGCTHGCIVPKLYEKLALYEELDEKGLLLQLPCKVGDSIYFIPSKVNFKLNILNKDQSFNRVYHQKIERIVFSNSKIIGSQGWSVQCDKNLDYGIEKAFLSIELGKTWFLSKEEAEQALAKLESEDENETD